MKLLITALISLLFLSSLSAQNNTIVNHSFVQGEKPLMTFGVIADIQYCDHDPVGTRYYKSSLLKLDEALKVLKSDSVKFIVNLGDMIDHDFESFKPVMDIIATSKLQMYHITGNHDYSVDAKLKNKLPVLHPSKKGYYSFVNGKIRMIFLNGNEISVYGSKNKTAIKQATDQIAAFKKQGEKNAFEWNGGIGKKQLIWLNHQLESATAKNEKVIILCHFPIVPDIADNLLNYKEVLQTLGKYQNIIAWFNGHNHAGNYGVYNKAHFVTFNGMVETQNDNSYALVRVYTDRIEIKGYGREPSRILPI